LPGWEKYFDDICVTCNGTSRRAVLDMTVQAASERILYGGMKLK